jgi:nicotinamide-nucleotide adenylyltransferase
VKTDDFKKKVKYLNENQNLVIIKMKNKLRKQKKKQVVLFLGRFQPFHLGHLHVVKSLIKKYDLVIGIGSANIKRSEMNPFSADERKKMINAVLKKEKITARIVKVPDTTLDDKYEEYVRGIVPFHVFACSNEFIKKYFSKKTKIISYKRFKNISATRIRKNICLGKDYEYLVHPEVYKLMKKIDAKKIILNTGCYFED